VPHGSREYRAAHHSEPGDKSTCGSRSRKTEASSQTDTQDRIGTCAARDKPRNSSVGWARFRADRRSHPAPLVSGRMRGEVSLQLGAGVRIDFAVQANFFKSRRCPSHCFPYRSTSGPVNVNRAYPSSCRNSTLRRRKKPGKPLAAVCIACRAVRVQGFA
jgi:hypothetical protein